MTSELAERAARIKLLLLDCDGVMTDGGLYVTPDGQEIRRFDVHDGYGVTLMQEAGIRVGLVSGKRVADSTMARARYLKLDPVLIGRFDKGNAVREILEETKLSPEEVAFAGDDVFDLPAMEIVGLSFSVANARPEVRKAADYVTEAEGGRGAVREIAELLLAARRNTGDGA